MGTMNTMPIKVLIVDDQEIVRRGLRMSLSLEDDLRIVGAAENGREALALAQTLAPDVLVMDVEMPLLDGIAATEILKTTHPRIAVLILSLYDTEDAKMRALRAGAFAFIPKHAPLDILIAAIHQAHTFLKERHDEH